MHFIICLVRRAINSLIYKSKKNLSYHFKVFTLVVMLFSLASIFTSTNAYAAGPECESTELTIASLFNPANYFPLIPASCGITEDGNGVVPIGLDQVPTILVRAYGALSSLTIYFGLFYLVYAGILYSASGADGSQKAKAIKYMQTVVVAIIMVLSAHIIVNTLIIILGIGEYANKDVASFFTPY
jgi:hypothetical protein